MVLRVPSRDTWSLLAALAVLVLAALSWDGLRFGLAVASSESRPSLLDEAEWGKPVPAFRKRFGAGTAEAGMLHWLADNDFEVDRRAGSGTRIIRSLPCNERVLVSWVATDGIISESNAVVSEAGCL